MMLYAYPCIESIIEQIDEIIERKAINSMEDYRPCINICNTLIDHICEKDIFIELKLKLDQVIKSFNREEQIYLDYKYFKIRGRAEFKGFDYSSREYFRKQARLIEKVKKRLITVGIDETKVREIYLNIAFFKELLRRVKEKERLTNKRAITNKGDCLIKNVI